MGSFAGATAPQVIDPEGKLMNDTHLTPRTRFVEVGGTRHAHRRWGTGDGRQPGSHPRRDISGDFREVMWFQGLTAFLQPAKVVACCNRTAS